MADVEQSLEPLQPPADGAKAPVPPQQPANAAQALVPPVSTQPTEAQLEAAVPKPKRNLRRSRAHIESQPATVIESQPVTVPTVIESQPATIAATVPTVIQSQPATPLAPVEEQKKKAPKNRKGQIGELLEDDGDKENGGANVNNAGNAGLLAKSK